MTTKIKLTDQNMKSYGGFQWKLGVPVPPLSGEGRLCSEVFYHFYDDLLVGLFMNPIHADIKNLRAFEAKVSGKSENDNNSKCGYTEATLTKELEVPKITLNQRVAFAIFCSLEVYKEEKYVVWAKSWLNGNDRTKEATAAATWAWAAEAAAEAAEAEEAEDKKIDFITLAKKAMEY